jgi:hypothetical protein
MASLRKYSQNKESERKEQVHQEWIFKLQLKQSEEENQKDVFKVKEKGLGIDPYVL